MINRIAFLVVFQFSTLVAFADEFHIDALPEDTLLDLCECLNEENCAQGMRESLKDMQRSDFAHWLFENTEEVKQFCGCLGKATGECALANESQNRWASNF